jgi:hypothetical protein
MGIRAAHSKRIQTRPAGQLIPLPFREFIDDVERRVFNLQFGIGFIVVERRREEPLPKRQCHLDQTGDSGGGIKVADVGLGRPQAAKIFLIGASSKRPR